VLIDVHRFTQGFWIFAFSTIESRRPPVLEPDPVTSRGRAIPFVLALGAVLPLAAKLAAEPATLVGRWQAGPLVVRWRITEWGTPCGPQPNGGGDSGGMVVVTRNGSDLTFTGLSRTFSTAACLDQSAGIGVTSHTASARAWQTTCKTAANDPRQVSLRTVVTATDSSISLEETGQYHFVIQGQRCTAATGRYRTYTLVQRAGSPAPAASAATLNTEAAGAAGAGAMASATASGAATNAPSGTAASSTTTSERCATLGEPARLEVRPQRKLIQAGERFTFRAQVLDAKGCTLPQVPTWSVASSGTSTKISEHGELFVPSDAPAGEVTLRAQVGTTQVDVVAEIAPKERYDALLRSGRFDTAGEVAAPVSGDVVSSTLGARGITTQDDAASRKRWFVIAVTAVGLLLGAGGLILALRTRAQHRRQVAQEREAALLKAQQRAASRPPPTPSTPAPPSQKVCPVCGGLYPDTMKFCGKDGTVLLPVN
jgi:hypothetical protein